MSLFFRDPFFDDFDSYLVKFPYCGKNCNCKEDTAMVNPASGFGRMDVVESDKEYDIVLDLPGMKKEELKTTIENNRLVVEGERTVRVKIDSPWPFSRTFWGTIISDNFFCYECKYV